MSVSNRSESLRRVIVCLWLQPPFLYLPSFTDDGVDLFPIAWTVVRETKICSLDNTGIQIPFIFWPHKMISHQSEMSSSECSINQIWYNQHQTDNSLGKNTHMQTHIHKSDTASLKSPEPHCVLAQQKQPIGNMQPETRRLPQRASHRPQSRDTPRVLLIQAGREPQPAIQPFSANMHRTTEIHKHRHPCCCVPFLSRALLKMGFVSQVCLEFITD